MVIDNHLHVGWFTDRYHSPREVWNTVRAAGVDEMVVSSTSTCAELYKVVVRELRELVRLGGDRIHPILWLTPRMMRCRYALPYMLHSKIVWQGIKLHWDAHPEWAANPKLLARALDVARCLGVPVLVHTGEKEVCRAGRFAEVISQNSDLIFVLAHGRPLQDTMTVLKRCDNALVDTAFMPAEDIKTLVENELGERILFGTDAPINEIYCTATPTSVFIKSQIASLRDALGDDAGQVLSRTVYRPHT